MKTRIKLINIEEIVLVNVTGLVKVGINLVETPVTGNAVRQISLKAQHLVCVRLPV